LSAFTAFGVVVIQEQLEFIYQWPWWARGIRAGSEEGTELVGVFLLLLTVVPERRPGQSQWFSSLFPSLSTLTRLRSTFVVISLLLLLPLGILTASAVTHQDIAQRGIPASWLPFLLLNLTAMTAWARSQVDKHYKRRFLLLGFLAALFALDQILVLERIVDKTLIRSSLGSAMFPCMAALCALISTLRSKWNNFLIAVLLPLSFFPTSSVNLVTWTILPLQSLGIFLIVASGRSSEILGTKTVCEGTGRSSLGSSIELFR
jgi:hypothetical protein